MLAWTSLLLLRAKRALRPFRGWTSLSLFHEGYAQAEAHAGFNAQPLLGRLCGLHPSMPHSHGSQSYGNVLGAVFGNWSFGVC